MGIKIHRRYFWGTLFVPLFRCWRKLKYASLVGWWLSNFASCWHSLPCCSWHGLAPAHGWERKSSLHSWQISYSTPVVGWALHRSFPPFDHSELVSWTGPIWWWRTRANSIAFDGVWPVFWLRSQAYGIAVVVPVCFLTYASWGRGVSVIWRVSTVATPSVTAVLALLIVSLLAGLFVDSPDLSVTQIGKFSMRGLDEGRDVLH